MALLFMKALLIDSLLKEEIGCFLATLQDPDINVRRVALGMLNSCAHNKPSLIRDLLPTLLPWLYNETKIRVSTSRVIFVLCGISILFAVRVCRFVTKTPKPTIVGFFGRKL